MEKKLFPFPTFNFFNFRKMPKLNFIIEIVLKLFPFCRPFTTLIYDNFILQNRSSK